MNILVSTEQGANHNTWDGYKETVKKQRNGDAKIVSRKKISFGNCCLPSSMLPKYKDHS